MPADGSARLTVDQRRAIFRALVEAQDAGAGVDASRTAVAGQFGVGVDQVRAVEREGEEKDWPPL